MTQAGPSQHHYLKQGVHLFIMLLVFTGAMAQPAPKLVKSFGMLPGTFAGKIGADLNGKFVTDSLGSLLISDGTDTGTHSILSGLYNIEAMLVVHGKLFVLACDSLVHGNELWISDGTTAGTHLIREINPVPGGSGILYFAFNDYSMISYHDKVYFYGSDGVHGVELWSSDGTDTGTMMVKDINTLPGADVLDLPNFPFGAMQVAGGKLYFAANDGVRGPELWCTDGTAANTHIVKDLLPGAAGANPQYLTALGDRMCFWAYNGADTGLYITDGTDTGTHWLASHIFTPNSEHAVMHNKLYFFADSTGVPYSSSLWVTDGTAPGTSWVSHAFYGTEQYSYYTYISSFLTAWNDHLYFGAADHLWQSNGLPGGTVMITDFSAIPGLCCTPTQIMNFGGRLYMRVKDFGGRVEVVSSDGTDTGTHVAACGGADYGTGSQFVMQNNLTAPMTVVGTKLFFWNTYKNEDGHSLYTIDIAASAVKDPMVQGKLSIYPVPAKNAITIETASNDKIEKIELYTTTGQLLSITTVAQKEKTGLILPDVREAILLIKVFTDKGIICGKVVTGE